jgi:L-fuculose-phosphate aldolase
MLRRRLVEGTAGNISARREDGNLVITPSSVDYAEMALDDLVVVDPTARWWRPRTAGRRRRR